jgi:hypothetical protein
MIMSIGETPARYQEGKKLGCSDVARSRARRYARQHPAARPFLPLFTIVTFVALIFQRVLFASLGSKVQDFAGSDANPAKEANALLLPTEKPDTLAASPCQGEPSPQYKPSSRSGSQHVAELIAFLIRNRGRIDTRVVQQKWDGLDQLSLPLALFLREIEATAGWDDLEREIAATRCDGPGASNIEQLKSHRHRKILQLLPDWKQRGEELLATDTPETESEPSPTTDVDGPDPKRPKP